MITVVILGIITAISMPLIKNAIENNRMKQYKIFLDTVTHGGKLYVDSYETDMFDDELDVECVTLTYKDLEEKDLIKDVSVDGMSCDSDKTSVSIVKTYDKYAYATKIGCGRKVTVGDMDITITLSEHEDILTTCDLYTPEEELVDPYRLTYNSNGGSVCNPSFIESEPGTEWGGLCSPSKENSIFLGWNTSLDGTGTTITEDSIAEADITVYAQWKAIEVSEIVELRYDYTGAVQTVTLAPGIYKMELWGAGSYRSKYPKMSSYGAYVAGNLQITEPTTFYIYVGQRGAVTKEPNWNGGGKKAAKTCTGGGATDIRMIKAGTADTDWNNNGTNLAEDQSLLSRIIVAAGGGGCGEGTGSKPGNGGLLEGSKGKKGVSNMNSYGGTQTAGGSGCYCCKLGGKAAAAGTFGKGGNTAGACGGGGGGGWYGGGAAIHQSVPFENKNCGASGGSSYVNGVEGYQYPDNYLYKNKYKFTDYVGKTGSGDAYAYASTRGIIRDKANSYNGYVIISKLG